MNLSLKCPGAKISAQNGQSHDQDGYRDCCLLEATTPPRSADKLEEAKQ